MKRKVSTKFGVLEYELERKRVKNLNLRVKDGGSIHVSANEHVPVGEIDKFVCCNAEKINAFLLAAKDKFNYDPEAANYDEGSLVPFRGKRYAVRIKQGDEQKVELAENDIVITIADPADVRERMLAVRRWLDESIMKYYTEMNDIVAERYAALGVDKARFRTRSMTSRWGSCKVSRGTMTINTRLIYYPSGCLEAVFVHEYAHFIHYNHDAEFYKLVTKMMPEYKAYDKLLKSGKF